MRHHLQLEAACGQSSERRLEARRRGIWRDGTLGCDVIVRDANRCDHAIRTDGDGELGDRVAHGGQRSDDSRFAPIGCPQHTGASTIHGPVVHRAHRADVMTTRTFGVRIRRGDPQRYRRKRQRPDLATQPNRRQRGEHATQLRHQVPRYCDAARLSNLSDYAHE